MRAARIWGSRRIRQRAGPVLSAHKAQAGFDRLLDSVACTTDTLWLRRLAVLRNGTSSVQLSVVRSPLCSSIGLTDDHRLTKSHVESSMLNGTQLAFCLCGED